MFRLLPHTLKVSLTVLALGLVAPVSAAEKEKPASFIGHSRDQVYSRLGEPRSVMKAGVREIMFFPKLKVTFRNGVVVETEEIFEEPPPPPPRKVVEAAAATASAGEAAVDTADTGKTKKAGSAQGANQTPMVESPAATKTTEVAQDTPKAAPAATSGGLEIKFVRPPTAGVVRPVPRPAPRPEATAPTVVPMATSAPSPAAVAVTAKTTATPSTTPVAMPAGQGVANATKAAAAAAPAIETKLASTLESTVEPAPAPEVTEAPQSKAPQKRFFRRRTDGESLLPEVRLFNAQTYLFAFAAVGAVGYLIWRARQRRLDLAATTVSNTPFEEPVAVDSSTLFTAELLAKLEWKRFEELVAHYYLKTGVVAVRTKTGPDSPVHLKISWKGEAKPFACVQCHASPVGLLRPPPLQALFAALTADDIRRGYVVTNGKFNVEARDFAEEKHFTLLPGDILLEKLNALPPAARAELMQETTTGDYMTPTCPKCDIKMVHTDDGGWRCSHAPKCEVVFPPKKKV
jgi:hypothetical protein